VSVASDTKKDIRSAKKLRLPRWAILPWILVGTLTCWLFDHFEKLDLALPTLISIGLLGFILVLKRKLWRQGWFWIVMTFIAAAHVELILLIPWTTKWVPAAFIAGIATVDLIVVLAILNYVGKLSEGGEKAL
jgi:hypothetical protein